MNWIHYLAEANLYMVAFYVLYVLLLRSETHYQLNRTYLLITSALSFVIPLIQLGILKPEIQTTANITISEMGSVDPMPMIAQSPVIAEAPKWTTGDYILLAYGIIALVLLVNLLIRIYLLLALSKKGSVQKNDGFNLIELHQGSVAFSFFNNLFIDDRLASSQTILYHEQVHIRQKHSWDIIYLELLKIFNWFNPIIYLVIASMKELHEFIADEQTVRLENNNDAYTDFLISNAYGITQNPLTSSFFNKNLLKRRIIMLYQKKSGKVAKLKYLLALPLICGLLCASTMAFTTKTYGFIDLVPQHPLRAIKHIAQRVTASVKARPVVDQTTNASVNPASTSAKSENTNPLIVVDGKIFTKPIPADFNFATASDREYAQLLGIDSKDIKGISVLKNEAAAARYGQQGANGVLIINTNTTVTTSVAVTDTPKNDPANVTNVISMPPARKVTDVVLAPPPASWEGPPQFPGGRQAFNQFIRDNIRYPKEDHDKNIQGQVLIRFEVELDGSLSDISIVHTPSETLGAEALRVIKLSPNWIPGTRDHKPAPVQYTVPVNFSLSAPASSAMPVVDPNNPNIIFTAVEVNPQFPGGEHAFGEFLMHNIHYPADDKKNGVQGRVYIQFVVERDGALTGLKVVRAPSDAMGAEAVRVLQLSPNWNPGVQNGKPVRVSYTVPINFSLGNGAPSSPNVIPVSKPDIIDPNNPNQIFVSVEVPPQFPGGSAAFGSFLAHYIRYPKADKENNVQGRVYMQFVVEPDGSLSNIKVLRAPSDAMGAEATRVLQLSPNWTPGVQNGRPVRARYTVPINFSLGDDGPRNISALYRFIRRNVHYPQEAKAGKVEGRVFVQFSLDENKQIQNIKVLKSIDPLLSDEVVRLLQTFKTIADGNTAYTYVIPVMFNLSAGSGKPDATALNISSIDYKPGADNRVALNEVVVTGYY